MISYEVIEPLQFAYCEKYNTETALIKIFNDLFVGMDKKEVILLLLLDLSAAIGTVDHHILLHRLENMHGYMEVLSSGSDPTLLTAIKVFP